MHCDFGKSNAKPNTQNYRPLRQPNRQDHCWGKSAQHKLVKLIKS